MKKKAISVTLDSNILDKVDEEKVTEENNRSRVINKRLKRSYSNETN
jgi:metal-responsive CopG/Arc/MetJ family transcriptional regulator